MARRFLTAIIHFLFELVGQLPSKQILGSMRRTYTGTYVHASGLINWFLHVDSRRSRRLFLALTLSDTGLITCYVGHPLTIYIQILVSLPALAGETASCDSRRCTSLRAFQADLSMFSRGANQINALNRILSMPREATILICPAFAGNTLTIPSPTLESGIQACP